MTRRFVVSSYVTFLLKCCIPLPLSRFKPFSKDQSGVQRIFRQSVLSRSISTADAVHVVTPFRYFGESPTGSVTLVDYDTGGSRVLQEPLPSQHPPQLRKSARPHPAAIVTERQVG